MNANSSLKDKCDFGGVAAFVSLWFVIAIEVAPDLFYLLFFINSGNVLKHCCLPAVIAVVTSCLRKAPSFILLTNAEFLDAAVIW
jgi:hypothetical protein